ncbi:hypothetical protein GCM10020000_78150 [Streptomyces olivoverticillatus]
MKDIGAGGVEQLLDPGQAVDVARAVPLLRPPTLLRNTIRATSPAGAASARAEAVRYEVSIGSSAV